MKVSSLTDIDRDDIFVWFRLQFVLFPKITTSGMQLFGSNDASEHKPTLSDWGNN